MFCRSGKAGRNINLEVSLVVKKYFTKYILGFLFFLSGFLFSQENLVDSLHPGFIRYDLNVIGNSAKGLKNFYEKLDNLENDDLDRVAIYHLGDSHVRAAFFAKEVAFNLQEFFGSAGGYMFYPAERRKAYRKKKKKKVTVRIKTAPMVRQFSEDDTTGIEYYIYGISGKTFNYFSDFDLLYKHIEEYEPDLIIITLGTNDAFAPKFDIETAQLHINSLITKIKKFNPDISILLTIPPDSYIKKKYANPNIAEIRDVIIHYCVQNDLSYWDLFSIMGGNNSMETWFRNRLAGKDKIHFTEVGYKLQGELLYKALINGYEQYISTGSR
jgi:lysophospholipase L1-like esterase